MSTLAEDRFLTDVLWERLALLIPPRPAAVNGRTGRTRVSDRRVFAGIVFVLLTGMPWMKVPPELGFGSGIHVLATVAGMAGCWGVGPAAAGRAR